MDVALILALGAVLFVVPSRLDRWALVRGASPQTLAALAAVTLTGLAALPLAFVACTGVVGASGHSDGLRVVAVAGLLLVAVAGGRAVARVVQIRRGWSRLAATASVLELPRTPEGLIVLPLPEVLAFVAGTDAFVSEGLLERLPAGQASAVVAHERAHQVARHGRLMSAAGAVTHGLFGFGPARSAERVLYRELDALADDAAARVTQDPAAVTQALRSLTAPSAPGGEMSVRLARLDGRDHARSGADAIAQGAALLLALMLVATICVAFGATSVVLGVLACSLAVAVFIYLAGPLRHQPPAVASHAENVTTPQVRALRRSGRSPAGRDER